MTLEAGLRELIAGIVRDEVRRALAEASKPEEYLTTVEAGELANVAPGTIRRWIREGRLAEQRAGRVVRVRRSDIERLLGSAPRRTPTRAPTPEELAARMFGDVRR